MRKDVLAKISLFKTVHKNMSLYYNISINWGDASDYIANLENIFVCWDKILEETIKIIFQNLESFQSKHLRQSSALPKPLSLRFTIILPMILKLLILWSFIETYSEPRRTSKIEHFEKIVSGWKPLTIFAKSTTLDVALSSEYASGLDFP